MKKFNKFLPPLLLCSAIVFIWAVYVHITDISQRILPTPLSVINSLVSSWDIILPHTLTTAAEVIIGFFISIVFAFVVSLLMYLSPKVRSALYPVLASSQTIPIIALAPLLLIWFGFGIMPKIIVVVLFSFFPIVISFSDGLANTPKYLLDYAKSLNASRWAILRHINIPSSLDSLFSGLKIGAVYAVTGAIVAEFVGAFSGLGVYLQQSAASYATARVFAVIFIVMIMSLILLGLVIIAQRIVMPWKYTDEK
jgi:ABC-type nitrate/sulfonate/bicarbonate transport system permease component